MAPFLSDLFINLYIKPKAAFVDSYGENHPVNWKFRKKKYIRKKLTIIFLHLQTFSLVHFIN